MTNLGAITTVRSPWLVRLSAVYTPNPGCAGSTSTALKDGMAASSTTRLTCTLMCSGVGVGDAVALVSVTPARLAKVESVECNRVSTATRSVANSASVVPGAAATVSATTTDEAEDATAPGGKGGCDGGWLTEESFPPPIPPRTTTSIAMVAMLTHTPPAYASMLPRRRVRFSCRRLVA